ncbi:MAG: M48 family metalloprotease [Bacteriovorax sp.]|nr:M48 family metalloprotease [Bacteriovorax sp.]
MFEFLKKNYLAFSPTKKNAKGVKEGLKEGLKDDFKKTFLRNANHQWILEDRVTKRSIETLLDSLSSKHIQFFTKHPTFMIPCQAHLSCAIGRTQNHHLILVFPELIQLLKSASAFHAIAILAHELGHIYHQHTEQKIDTLTAQIEADQFAFDLGFGEELQEVLLDHVNSVDCRVRISRLTTLLITQKK